MIELAQLHTLVRTQVKAGDRQVSLSISAVPGDASSPITQHALATWRRAREMATSRGDSLNLVATSDEWTVQKHNNG